MNLTDSDLMALNVELGREARRFAESTLGKWMVLQWDARIDTALEELAKVDPLDGPAVMKAQNEVRVSHALRDEFFELMNEGEQALQLAEEHEG